MTNSYYQSSSLKVNLTELCGLLSITHFPERVASLMTYQPIIDQSIV